MADEIKVAPLDERTLATLHSNPGEHADDSDESKVTEQLIDKQVLEQTNLVFGVKCNRLFLIMIACFLNHIIVVGFISALGVLYVVLIREFNSTRSEAVLVQSLYFGLTVSGGIVFSSLVVKYGPGICVALGMSFSAITVFVSAFSVNIYMVIVFVGVLCSIGTSITFMCDLITVSWAFGENRKTALALLTIGSTIGQVTFPYLAEIMIEKYFWKGTMLLFSGIILHGLPCGLLVHFSKNILQEKSDNQNNSNASIRNYIRLFTSCNMVFVIFIMLVMEVGSNVEYYFTVDLSKMRGYDRNTGALFLSLIGLSSLAGRVTGTGLLALCRNIDATAHYVHSLILFAISHFLVINYSEYTKMLIGVILEGFSTGLTVSVFPGFLIEQFQADNFPAAVASTNLISGVFNIFIGFLGGLAADLTGGYDLIYYIAAVSAGLGSLVTSILLLCRNRCFNWLR